MNDSKKENSTNNNINWFPGHMAKTRRKIKENLAQVDAVAELLDARIPISSRNPEMRSLTGEKPQVVLLNKADAADEAQTRQWLAYYKQQGAAALAVDCRSGKGLQQFAPAVRALLQDKIAGWNAKGMTGRCIRVMVVGIPNVGKSSFINRMAGGSRAKVEDRPGVTRGNQWFSIGKGLELLDTPGVLWPKFEDPVVGERLAFIGSIRDTILDTEQLAARLACLLARDYPRLLCARYKLPAVETDDGFVLLEQIGRKRGMLISGGEVDLERAAAALLDEFRGGKLGRITLEKPESAG